MSKKTVLRSVADLQRWLGKTTAKPASPTDAILWVESPHCSWDDTQKAQMRRVILGDRAHKGTVEELKLLNSLGYDLGTVCTPQQDGNALHAAAQYGKHHNCMALIEMGLRPEHRIYPQTDSVLDEALTNLHLRLFEKLLKHSPEPTPRDRVGWLTAALSRKVRQAKNSYDHPRNKCVAYVLDKCPDAFDQETLDQALVLAAKAGWPQTFATLVKAGANPQRECVLMNNQVFGDGTLLLLLFLHLPLDDWSLALRRHIQGMEGFYPSSSAEAPPTPDKPLLDIDTVYQKLLKRSPSQPGQPELTRALDTLRAQHRQRVLNAQLATATAQAPRSPRF